MEALPFVVLVAVTAVFLIARGVVRWTRRHKGEEGWWVADAPVRQLAALSLLLSVVAVAAGIHASDVRLTPGLLLEVWGWGTLAALAAGILGVAWASRSRGRIRGAGLAALATALAAALLSVGAFSLVLQVFAHASEKARVASCLSNTKQISLALLMYAEDNDDRLPRAENWQDAVMPYAQNEGLFRCLLSHRTQTARTPGDYALNGALAGRKLDDIREPHETVLLFESDHGPNAAGGPEFLPSLPRHDGGDSYAFASGYAKWLRRVRDPRAPFWRNQTLKQPAGDARWRP